MPRSTAKVIAETSKAQISPVLFVRVLNMPELADPTKTNSLYLTDCDYDPAAGKQKKIMWFDENEQAQEYFVCGVKFEQVQVGTDNQIETSRVSLDNIDRKFSAMAQYSKLNGVEVHVLRGYRELLKYPDGAQLLFVGHLKKAAVSEYAITAEVWNDFSLKKRCPGRMYSATDFRYIPASKDVRQVYRG